MAEQAYTPSVAAILRSLVGKDDPSELLYQDAHYFAATVEADPAAMRRWLPGGVRLAEPARAEVFTAYFPQCVYSSAYHEAGILVHVKVGRRTGLHCPWMILDDDVALILGRELLGYPKKLGEIDWSITGETIRAAAGRRGHPLITMNGKLGERLADAPPFLGRPHRNAMGLLGLSLPRLIAFTPGEHPIEVRRIEDFHLTIAGSALDPLDLFGLGRVIEARLHRVNLTPGSVPVPIRPLWPGFLVNKLRPRVY